jgi:hypothetical protein
MPKRPRVPSLAQRLSLTSELTDERLDHDEDEL